MELDIEEWIEEVKSSFTLLYVWDLEYYSILSSTIAGKSMVL